MTWIRMIEEEEARGKLAEYFAQIRNKRGKVASILKVQSLNPESLRAHLDLYLTIMYRRSSLSRRQREMIAVAVSSANECDYCVLHHSEALESVIKDHALVEQVAVDYKKAELSESEHAMLNYAVKLTRHPQKISKEDVAILRDHDLDDEDILNISLVTSYFNFVNRMANGLGVDIESVGERRYYY